MVTPFTLHKLVLKKDVAGLEAALKCHSITQPHPEIDIYHNGYSPLTLAIHLTHRDCVELLLNAGASLLVKDDDHWSPYDESVSMGDRETIKMILKARKKEIKRWIETVGKDILLQISQV